LLDVQSLETTIIECLVPRPSHEAKGSHIGIPGNERADRHVSFESHLGVVANTPGTVSEEGIRAISRARRREERHKKGFGLRRSDWHRKAAPA